MKTRIPLRKMAYHATAFLLLLLSIVSCAPVNRMTRAKKVPREHRINYDEQWAKAPRKFYWNTDPWIVFSDKTDNKTYTRPGGRIVMKEIGFMEPMVVIKRKGEYLRVIRYSKEVIKNGKLTNRKAAEYMGWIPERDVLLSRDGLTSTRNSQHSKFVTAISEQVPLLQPNLFFSTDSIRIFSEPSLIQQQGTLPFSSIVYKMKESLDGQKSLIAKEPYLAADTAHKQIIGWISNDLLSQAGQRYFIGEHSDQYQNCGYSGEVLKYHPVNYYCRQDSVRKFQTGLYRPVLDYSDNFVLNVDGQKISHSDYLKIGKYLTKLNLVFVFEGEAQVISQFPQLVNTIQNLQGRIESANADIRFTFNAVIGFQKEKEPFIHIRQEKTFLSFMDSLYSIADHIKEYKRIIPSYSSSALKEALEGLENYKKETNVIILIGTTGHQNEKTIASLSKQMAEYNTRLLGFQLYGGEQDTYNNFVLQVQTMIDKYAELISTRKRKILVSTEQLSTDIQYKEHNRNMYSLDFPKNSMTQGWVIFPGKNQTLELNALSAGIDTLLTQIEQDNKSVMNYLSQSFRRAGNYRSKFDSLMTCYYNLQDNPRQQRVFANHFVHKIPVWSTNSDIWHMPDSLLSDFEHYLLVDTRELKQVLEFMKYISSEQVDIKRNKSNSQKRKKRKKCDCPEPVTVKIPSTNDTLSEIRYRSTRKIRKRLARYYIYTINENRVCKISKRRMKRQNLAWIHENILGCPTENEWLSLISLKDVKKKKKMSDERLDELLSHYKQKKESFEMNISNLPNFLSNGQTYYWINNSKLP